MSKVMKQAIVKHLVSTLDGQDSAVVVDVGALTAQESEGLRVRMREKDMHLLTIRNRLAAIAFEKVGLGGLETVCKGPASVAFGGDGAIDISKLVIAETKTLKNLRPLGAYMDGEVLDADGVEQLSKMPGRDELLAMIMSGMFGPVSELARSMDGLLTEVHGLIGALEEKGGASAD